MASGIGKLPEEILVFCLGFLPKAHLKSARLTCIRWGAIGAERLFDRIYFAPRKDSLEYFKAVSSNPVFGKNITELVYDARLFQEQLLNYQNFKSMYDELEDDVHDSEEIERGAWSEHNNQDRLYRARVSQSLIQYTMLFTQQKYILDGSHDYETLCDGLKQMPNITKLRIVDTFSSSLFDGTGYEHKSMGGRGSALQPSEWTGNAEQQNSLLHQYLWDCRGWVNLIRAVSTSHLVIKELYMYIGAKSSSAPL